MWLVTTGLWRRRPHTRTGAIQIVKLAELKWIGVQFVGCTPRRRNPAAKLWYRTGLHWLSCELWFSDATAVESHRWRHHWGARPTRFFSCKSRSWELSHNFVTWNSKVFTVTVNSLWLAIMFSYCYCCWIANDEMKIIPKRGNTDGNINLVKAQIMCQQSATSLTSHCIINYSGYLTATS